MEEKGGKRWLSQARSVDAFGPLTVALEPLPDQAKEHLAAVVAEGRRPVRVHVERMRANLEVFRLCRRWER